jgi:hypothetical protein
MTTPGHQGSARRATSGDPEPNPFAEAEKLMAQWEARHDIAASGRRPGPGVSEYLSHERCAEACSTPAQEHRRPRPGESRARRNGAPPDPHPHLSDFWGWLGGPPSRPRDA